MGWVLVDEVEGIERSTMRKTSYRSKMFIRHWLSIGNLVGDEFGCKGILVEGEMVDWGEFLEMLDDKIGDDIVSDGLFDMDGTTLVKLQVMRH